MHDTSSNFDRIRPLSTHVEDKLVKSKWKANWMNGGLERQKIIKPQIDELLDGNIQAIS